MRPRYPNVTEQNEETADLITKLTQAFRDRTANYPEALYSFLASNKIDASRCVLITASTAEQGINPISGLLLAQDERFVEFDLDCSADGLEVLEIHSWKDETASQNLDDRNPGFSKGIGRIALEVLKRFRSFPN